jgi:hypothetical protein
MRTHQRSTALVVAAAIFGGTVATAGAASKLTGKDIRDGTLQVNDLSKKARKKLRGARGTSGAKGAPGAQGPAGQPGSAGAQGAAGGIGATGTVDTSDFFTKAQSDARFLGIAAEATSAQTATNATNLAGIPGSGYVRTAPRNVIVRATGSQAADGQALRDALAGLPVAGAGSPIVVQLTGGTYDVSAADADLPVPAFVTLRGAGRRATLLATTKPVTLAQGSALETINVSSFSAGTAGVTVEGTGALVNDADITRNHNISAIGIRVNTGATASIRNVAIADDGFGVIADVIGLQVAGGATVLGTTIVATGGVATQRGIDVTSGGTLTMQGGTVNVVNEDAGGTTTAVQLSGASASLRGTQITTTASIAEAVTGVRVTAGSASLAGVSIFADSSLATDRALVSGVAGTRLEGSQIEVGAGDTAVETTAVAAKALIGASRITATTPATGTGTATCVFSYKGDFTALSSTCT